MGVPWYVRWFNFFRSEEGDKLLFHVILLESNNQSTPSRPCSASRHWILWGSEFRTCRNLITKRRRCRPFLQESLKIRMVYGAFVSQHISDTMCHIPNKCTICSAKWNVERIMNFCTAISKNTFSVFTHFVWRNLHSHLQYGWKWHFHPRWVKMHPRARSQCNCFSSPTFWVEKGGWKSVGENAWVKIAV